MNQAHALLDDIGPLTAAWRRLSVLTDDIAAATGLVARLDLALRLPDAIHIAIARRIGSTLVTTDHQQARAARAIGLSVAHPDPGDIAP